MTADMHASQEQAAAGTAAAAKHRTAKRLRLPVERLPSRWGMRQFRWVGGWNHSGAYDSNGSTGSKP